MQIKIADYFLHCNDIKSMKLFYTDIIGLEQKHYNTEVRHLSYKIDENTYFVILESKESLPVKTGWAKGPVFKEGSTYDQSWTIRIESLDTFQSIVKKIKEHNVPTFSPEPKREKGFSMWLVKDPMGNTVEIYCTTN